MANMRGGADRLQQRRTLDQITRDSAEAQAGRADVVQWMRLGDLVALDDIQVRAGGLHQETVERYAVIMYEARGWGELPPLDVHHDRQYGWLISDGFHRHAGAQLASLWLIRDGAQPIHDAPVIERPEGFGAALDYAEVANLKNAKELTNADRKNLLWRRMERDHPWAQLGDRALARELGVSHPTIKAWKAEFADGTGKYFPVSDSHAEKIVTKSGQTMDVSAIKKANRKRAKQPPTTTQRKRAAVKALRAAAEHLRALDVPEADNVDEFADTLAGEWGV